MAVVYKKSGFLGLGGSVRHVLCDGCGCDVENKELYFNSVPNTSLFFCRDCAIQRKINLEPHDWPTDQALATDAAIYRSWWCQDKNDGKSKFIKHCFQCNALLVGEAVGSKLSRQYYKVGEGLSTLVEPKCHRAKIEFLNGHNKRQLECEHEFITVASSRDDGIDAKKTYDDLKNSVANKFFAIDHEAAAFGRKYVWCKKCGLFYDLPRYREGELKSRGINLDWYL
jgi:hypothetical protein